MSGLIAYHRAAGRHVGWLLGVLLTISWLLVGHNTVANCAKKRYNQPALTVKPCARVYGDADQKSADGKTFSGTGCTIRGEFLAGKNQRLTAIQLWVSGKSDYSDADICRLWIEWPAGQGPATFGLTEETRAAATRPFSSTQFDGAIRLKAKCRDTSGRWSEEVGAAVMDVTALNKGLFMHYKYFANAHDAAERAKDWLTNANRSAYQASGPYDSLHEDQLRPLAFAGHTVLHAEVHGNPELMGDCLTTPIDEVPREGSCSHVITTVEIYEDIVHNAVVPYTFVLLAACDTGTSAAFQQAFNAKSMIAWQGRFYTSTDYADWIKVLWFQLMSVRSTVGDAVDSTHLSYPYVTGYAILPENLGASRHVHQHYTSLTQPE